MFGKQIKRTQVFLKRKFGSAGSVLVEFAFCCPVLIILLFFVLDVPLAYRVTLKMQKMSELAANMIRNVPRKSDTILTINDLKNISAVTGLSMTGKIGTTAVPQVNYPFFLSTYVFCIVGNSTGGFDKKWVVHVKNNLYNGTIVATRNDSSLTYSQFKNVSNFSTIEELKGFNIQEGETRLIVETVAWYNTDGSGITAFADYGITRLQNLFNNSVNSTWLALLGFPQTAECSTTRPTSSSDFTYKPHSSRDGYSPFRRGFNRGFYLMTIPGKTVSTGVKTFGNRFSIMSSVDEIVDVNDCPE